MPVGEVRALCFPFDHLFDSPLRFFGGEVYTYQSRRSPSENHWQYTPESVLAMVGALFHTHPEVTATMPSYEERSTKRPDQYGKHRSVFESNKKKILATQTVCGICGKPVDKSFKFPHPLSPSIDHIIPVDKGGHPSDMSNLQLAHLCCNRFKSDKLVEKQTFDQIPETISNRVLPCLIDWKTV